MNPLPVSAPPAGQDLGLAHPDAEARLQAVKKALAGRDARAVPAVLQRLPREPAAKVKAAMIRLIGRLGSPAQLKELLPHAEDREPAVRGAVARAVADARHAPYYTLLVRMLDDADEGIRTWCGQTLTTLGKDLPTLLAAMFGAPTPWMRLAAIRGCRRFKGAAIEAILERAVSDGDPAVREEAARGLRRHAEWGDERAAAAVARLSAPPAAPAVPPLHVNVDWEEYHESASSMDIPAIRPPALPEAAEPGDATEELPRHPAGTPAAGPAVAVAAELVAAHGPTSAPLARPVRTRATATRPAGDLPAATKPCTVCGRPVLEAALKCRHCGELFDPEALRAALAKRGGRKPFYPYVRGSRVAAYMFDSVPVALISIIPLLGGFVGGIYFVCRDAFEGGQYTFKRLLKLKVVDARTGGPATLQQSVVRNLVMLPSVLMPVALFIPVVGPLGVGLLAMCTGLVFMVDMALVLMGRSRLTDSLAGTAVVQTEDVQVLPTWAAVGMVVVTVLPLVAVVAIAAFAAAFSAPRGAF